VWGLPSAFIHVAFMSHSSRTQANQARPWEGYDENNMLSMPAEWQERFKSDESTS